MNEAAATTRQFVCEQGHRWQAAGTDPTAALDAVACPECGAPAQTYCPDRPAAPGPAAWPNVPGYEVLGELGRGGMGVVYKAFHGPLKRVVALKMIRGGPADGEALARFRAEAEAAARLRHPHIVQVFDVGEHDGLPFFTMEFVDGPSLRDRLQGRPLPPAEAARLALALAEAVSCAHGRGVVHRDLKPANILIAPDGSPRVADFGIARCLDDDHPWTRTGVVLGTPGYMAPEQAGGAARRAGAPADVWALGAILYETLTGRPAFLGGDLFELLDQVRTREPVPVRRLAPWVPRDLETICLKCLRKEPTKRYATARELAEDLSRFLAGEPVKVRPVGVGERVWKWAKRRPAAATLVGVVGAAGLVLAAGVWKYQSDLEGQNQALEESLLNVQKLQQRTRASFDRSLLASNTLVDRLAPLIRPAVDTQTDQVREVLASAAQLFHDLEQEGSEEAGLGAARAATALCEVHQALNDTRQAVTWGEAAVKIYQRLGETMPDNPTILAGQADASHHLSRAYSNQGRLPLAVEHARKARDLLARLAELEPGRAEWGRKLGAAEVALGKVFARQAADEDSASAFRRARQQFDNLPADVQTAPAAQKLLADCLEFEGDKLWYNQDLDGAMKLYQRCQEIYRGLARKDSFTGRWEDSWNAEWMVGFAHITTSIGETWMFKGEHDSQAREALTLAADVASGLLARNRGNVLAHLELARARSNLLQMIANASEVDPPSLRAALHDWEGLTARLQKLADEDPANAMWEMLVGVHLVRQGQIHRGLAKADVDKDNNLRLARSCQQKALQMQGRLVEHDPTNATWCQNLYVTLRELVLTQTDLGEAEQARRAVKEWLSRLKPLRQAGAPPPLNELITNLEQLTQS